MAWHGMAWVCLVLVSAAAGCFLRAFLRMNGRQTANGVKGVHSCFVSISSTASTYTSTTFQSNCRS